MKKLLICFLTFICASFSFAELKRYDRKFEFGIETEVNLKQYLNALYPISVTEFGIVTEVKPIQS